MAEEAAKTAEQIVLWDERSDTVQEILGRAPNKFIRIGNSAIAGIVLAIILASALISYNDVIPARVVITSKNPPAYLKANHSGKLTEVFVSPEEQVKEGGLLAEIENTAHLEHVLGLKQKISDLKPEILSLDTLRSIFPPNLELGPIQTSYGEFITEYQNFLLYNVLTPDKKEANVLSQQLQEQRSLLDKQRNQLQLFEQDLEFSKKAYARSKQLYDKGVISRAEFENSSRQYLSDKQQYEGFKATISTTQIAIANYNNLLVKTDIQSEELTNGYRQKLEKSIQNLKQAIREWEQTYTIISPIDGKVTVFDIWNKNQNVQMGETIFTVIPHDPEGIIGRATLPVRNSGKVEEGQKVIIKLDNFPFREWGSLEGRIHNISEVPKQGEQTSYTVYISIDNLTTSYKKDIEFRQEMQGTAEIVTEELSVLKRVFFTLSELFDEAS